MLLESIKLVNFRQFRNETVNFPSGDNGKNVTIIIGENGTGKTTFAQAFTWCMYGISTFEKTLLNIKTGEELFPNDEATVLVELKLKHGEVSYTLRREQKYKKGSTGKITPQNAKFDIAKRGPSGETEYIGSNQCEAEIKKILPKELSQYFFFDGERIERMSKEISTSKKSSDFLEAVNGLLGLYAIMSAIEHFRPNNRISVIRNYENRYDPTSNKKIKDYTDTIERCNQEIENIDNHLAELEDTKNAAEARKNSKIEELKQYADSKRLQEEREKLMKDIADAKQVKVAAIKNICKDFNAQLNYFFSANMMNRALNFLAEQDFTGKDIPYMHAKTIEYLLKQGECICGTCLQDGSIAYRKVHDLIDYLPPQSLSTSVSDFKKEASSRAKNSQDLKSLLNDNLGFISKQNEDIDSKNEALVDIESRLLGGDMREIINGIEREIQNCEKIIKDSDNELIEERAKKMFAERTKETADTQRRNLTLLDDNNRKIEIYKAYAERIFKEFDEKYSDLSEKVRNKLEKTINDIFKEIYGGGMILSINDNYHISVSVDEYNGIIETSTAQSIAVIFAFIAAIIKMARENKGSSDEDAQLLSSESYPLVMDAPLSTFDKRRIENVCKTLPKIAEQVIIFIKDTDGELAEKFMGSRIGSKHIFKKQGAAETIIE